MTNLTLKFADEIGTFRINFDREILINGEVHSRMTPEQFDTATRLHVDESFGDFATRSAMVRCIFPLTDFS